MSVSTTPVSANAASSTSRRALAANFGFPLLPLLRHPRLLVFLLLTLRPNSPMSLFRIPTSFDTKRDPRSSIWTFRWTTKSSSLVLGESARSLGPPVMLHWSLSWPGHRKLRSVLVVAVPLRPSLPISLLAYHCHLPSRLLRRRDRSLILARGSSSVGSPCSRRASIVRMLNSKNVSGRSGICAMGSDRRFVVFGGESVRPVRELRFLYNLSVFCSCMYNSERNVSKFVIFV